MESLKTLLIANRGEIAVRIIRTAKSLGIRTISIYSEADAASSHVSSADQAVLLQGHSSSVYTDGDNIIAIAKDKGADAIIPGYGFLSENADFARKVKSAGISWCGPSPEAIEAFGVKHVARGLAEKAGVPIVPGTKGLVESADEAVTAAENIGFPVMLKATGGGGGMGLVTCMTNAEVIEGFQMVQSRGRSLFGNAGLFIEKYYPASHHIEVQVLGNGQGKAIHFGERECSIQRRHQKVIEECPSPFVEKHPNLREKLTSAAISLAESVRYGSVGTVEYLVDDESGDYFFLEMNTRLQVEHGITELCYDIDLVKLMLQQADAELSGQGGLSVDSLKSLQSIPPKGAAVEARIYAENPARNFAPSPGLLQAVEWPDVPARIDTWVYTGSTITPNYDPLIAKVMCRRDTRPDVVSSLQHILTDSRICGPPTNLEFLAAILENEKFKAGHTLTKFLTDFDFKPAAIDVISAGAYTLVQDLPGRPAVGKGIPQAGPMDPVAFSLANMLVGNKRGTEGLEITLTGPELRFIQPAVIALTGATMEHTLDGQAIPMWTRTCVEAGQSLKIGKTTGPGCRAYLAIYGGLPAVPTYFGSKSTSPLVSIGGYQGRALAPGDLLAMTGHIPAALREPATLQEALRPTYAHDWKIMTMAGPHDEGYFTPEDIDMIYNSEWKISHNASRSGIRLVGPVPKFSRKDGGEGGAHPSNLVEYGYPLGALNWTGDDPCIFPVDAPNFGGFVSSNVIIKAEWWKLGQVKAGDTLRYKKVTLDSALALRRRVETFLDLVEEAIATDGETGHITPIQADFEVADATLEKSIVWERAAQRSQPQVRYRQGGDDYIIVEYGNEQFDLNHRCRVTALEKVLHATDAPEWLKDGLINTVGCCTSITLFYDGLKVDRPQLISHLQNLETRLGDLRDAKVPCRRFRLPIAFESKEQKEAIKRYMETQRPHAPYLPDNLSFVARNNAFTPEELKQIYLTGTFMAVVVGFFCGNTVSLPVNPLHRMSCPKQNPSRVYTPAGTVSWGGSCMSLYPVDSPGGYQMTGRTIPCFDMMGTRSGFSPSKPWLFEDFDLITYYEVSEADLEEKLALFSRGAYGWEYEDVVFDMAEHNKLLEDTEAAVSERRKRQAIAQQETTDAEAESLRLWREERSKSKPDENAIDALLADPAIITIEAPTDANIWKFLVAENQILGDDGDKDASSQRPSKQTVLAVLEAMKLEINICLPMDEIIRQGKSSSSSSSSTEAQGQNSNESKVSVRVEKILVAAGETVRAGSKLMLLRRL
ncbi:hypothetical protein AAFC00_001338 [Neodothiora populina]|uniref:Urea carboxylase n=1 Tax=Neodothiora populina TaxID=2781224 RepID=A0ABR3PNK2_9PEZI